MSHKTERSNTHDIGVLRNPKNVPWFKAVYHIKWPSKSVFAETLDHLLPFKRKRDAILRKRSVVAPNWKCEIDKHSRQTPYDILQSTLRYY